MRDTTLMTELSFASFVARRISTRKRLGRAFLVAAFLVAASSFSPALRLIHSFAMACPKPLGYACVLFRLARKPVVLVFPLASTYEYVVSFVFPGSVSVRGHSKLSISDIHL